MEMAKMKEQIGVYNCWSCSREVPVKKTDTGKLSAACAWCDMPHYANEGTEHFKNLLAVTKLHRTPAPEPAPALAAKPEPAPQAQPEAPKRRSLLPSFGGAK